MKVKLSAIIALLLVFSQFAVADYDLSLSSPVWTMLSVKRGNYVEMDYYFLSLLQRKKQEDAAKPIVEENHSGRMIASVNKTCDPSGESRNMPKCSGSVEQQWVDFNAQTKFDACEGLPDEGSCRSRVDKTSRMVFRMSTHPIEINEFGDIATSHMSPEQANRALAADELAQKKTEKSTQQGWTDLRCSPNNINSKGQACIYEGADGANSSTTTSNQVEGTDGVNNRNSHDSGRAASIPRQNGSSQSGQNNEAGSVSEEDRQFAAELNKEIQQLKSELQSCGSSSDKVATFCGGDRAPANANLVRQFLGTENKNLFEQLAFQVAQINSAGKDMLKQCQTMKSLATTVTAIEGAYSAACIGYQASCRTTCRQVQDRIAEKSNQANGARYASLREQGIEETMSVDPIRTLATLQAEAANNLTSCQAPAQAGASASLSKTVQSAQMLMQASQCVSALQANQACLSPQDMSKPECRNFCSLAQNSNSSLCISKTNLNCADPAVASTQPACLCINSPNDSSCKYAGGGSVNYPFPGGSSGRSGDSESSSSSLPGGGAAGTFGSGGDDGMQSSSSRNGAPHAGGLANFKGSGGGGAPASGGGGQGLQSPRGGSPGAGGYNADIMNGFYEGGGGRRGGGAGGSANGGGQAGYGGRNTASAQPSKVNLRDFLPNGRRYKEDPRKLSFAGSAVLTRDGVTGPHGPSLFEKVSRRYKMKGSLLTQ